MSSVIPGRMNDPIADLTAGVAAIKATLPHLATKHDLGELRALIERVDGNIAKTETSLIKCVVGSAIACIGTAIACTGLAFTATKLVH
jgi:hypothetical protein